MNTTYTIFNLSVSSEGIPSDDHQDDSPKRCDSVYILFCVLQIEVKCESSAAPKNTQPSNKSNLNITNVHCGKLTQLSQIPNISRSRSDSSPNAKIAYEFVNRIKTLVSKNPNAFELCSQGTGGTYFVRENGTRVAVFKPVDEEPGAVNNPKQTTVCLLPPGGGAVREVAAYLIDNGHAKVPQTHLLENLEHSNWKNSDGSLVSKTGSIQEFIVGADDVADLSSSLFSVEDVHNIGIMDIRLFNLDRNGENILAIPTPGKKEYRLVPIDHAYILPANFQQTPFFEWQFWKQAKVPFSPETLKFIENIDIEADSRVLSSLGIPDDCIRTMRISTTLLKKFASSGATLSEIASMVCDQLTSGISSLEEIVRKAENSCSEHKGPKFFQQLEKLLDEAITERLQKGSS